MIETQDQMESATEGSESDQEELAADQIDESFVPIPRPEVESREVDGDVILYDTKSGNIDVLNSMGLLVWGFFDGKSSLAELIGDFADAYDAATEVVAHDILELTRRLGGAGLLVGVAEVKPPTAAAPDGLSIGHEVIFTLPGADGAIIDLAQQRGRRTLLVNWSPYCGYCVGLAPKLAEIQPALAEAGVDMVMLSVGEAQPNLVVFEEHPQIAKIALKTPDMEGNPFPGLGTPAAYLLDEDLKVASPLAYGSGAVPVLAQQALSLSPATDHGHDHHHEMDDDSGAAQLVQVSDGPRPKHVAVPDEGVCGPSSNSKAARTWSPTRTFAVGEYHLGVRADSEATEQLLDRVFAAHRIDIDDGTPTNYSVILPSGKGAGKARGLNLLLVGNNTVVRSRSPRRVVDALAVRLSYFVDNPTSSVPSRELEVYAVPAILDGKAVLLPAIVANWIEEVQPKLARAGLRLVDVPFATVDTFSAELVVPAPALDLDLVALSKLPGDKPAPSEGSPVVPGRYPIAAWCLWPTDPEQKLSRAASVAAALPYIQGPLETLPDVIGQMDDLFQRVTALPVSGDDPAPFLASLKNALHDLSGIANA